MALNNFEISKILTGPDVQEKVGLPVQIVEHMNPVMNGEHSVDLTALDRWGQRWPLKYYTRPNDRRKPVFTVGWRQLVADNGVLSGDRLIFSRQQDASDQMPYFMIQVKRQMTTLEGETVHLDVMKRRN